MSENPPLEQPAAPVPPPATASAPPGPSARPELTTDQRLALVLRAVQRLEGRIDFLSGKVDAIATVADGLRHEVQMLAATEAVARAREGAAPGPGRTDERLAGAVREVADELESVLEGNEALRGEVHRSVERVLAAVGSVERTVSGEAKAVDGRLSSMSDDLRTVRVLRDGLQGVDAGVDALRQMVGRAVLEPAVSPDWRPAPRVSQVVDVPSGGPRADAAPALDAIADLSRRIDALAASMAAGGVPASTPPSAGANGAAPEPVAETLGRSVRRVARAARSLGTGVRDDLRRKPHERQ